MGTDTVSDIPIRNVQRETFNSQLSTGWPKGRIVAGIWGQTRSLGDRTLYPADLRKRWSDGPSRLGAQIWGQTRCPMCRAGTFNVKRSTLKFQWGDRKGTWWPGYGDRHGVTATRITGPVVTLLWRRYLQCLYLFSAGVRRGQGTKSQRIFRSLAGQRFQTDGCRRRVFAREETLVPATPGWGMFVPMA